MARLKDHSGIGPGLGRRVPKATESRGSDRDHHRERDPDLQLPPPFRPGSGPRREPADQTPGEKRPGAEVCQPGGFRKVSRFSQESPCTTLLHVPALHGAGKERGGEAQAPMARREPGNPFDLLRGVEEGGPKAQDPESHSPGIPGHAPALGVGLSQPTGPGEGDGQARCHGGKGVRPRGGGAFPPGRSPLLIQPGSSRKRGFRPGQKGHSRALDNPGRRRERSPAEGHG